ncbi:MAG: pyridoxamine 5'-phosphate oxidase family protein [Dehalococcoidia bacterium]|nr:MAG: pyridoxamine 5'-phosphate oxidase family protein [Dehalococcoidia bacterium]
MKLSEYFENTKGKGVLATADSNGKVDAAVYARPHFITEDRIVFITTNRLTHKNLTSNPHAVYLFLESGEGFKGKRLYLKKSGEEQNPDLIDALRRKSYAMSPADADMEEYLVYFQIDRVRPLVGNDE